MKKNRGIKDGSYCPIFSVLQTSLKCKVCKKSCVAVGISVGALYEYTSQFEVNMKRQTNPYGKAIKK